MQPATEDEAASFNIMKPGLGNLLTVVRRTDGARVTFNFQTNDDTVRACNTEFVGWFDEDLDRSTAANG